MKKQFRVLIVDDIRLARKRLIKLLRKFKNIEVIGEADEIEAAAQAIKKYDPDVIFLDIHLGGELGFDLFNKVKITSKIIFVTAFDKYAVQAFNMNALDYLLKPVTIERLTTAVEKLENTTNEKNRLENLEYDGWVFLMLRAQYQFLKISDIVAIQAADYYSLVTTKDNKSQLATKSLKEWELALPNKVFVRIHRSTIINLEYYKYSEKWHNYSYHIYLDGIKEPFLISRRYASQLKKKLGF